MAHPTIELAAAFKVLNPQIGAVEQWIGALRSGQYKQGFGVLRDGDDLYDPMGVLADINSADWNWDAAEGAWGVDGESIYLKGDSVVEYLGCTGRTYHIESLTHAVADLSDEGNTFAQIAAILSDAMHRANREREELGSMLRGYDRQRRDELTMYEYRNLPPISAGDIFGRR